MRTPILFIVFNRLDLTKKVFLSIKNAKPPKLYIASDGPRFHEISDEKNINEIRSYLLKNIDWNCEVKTLFRDTNLGCKVAVSDAITWFFKSEKEGIILEDDCLPSQSFFVFCEDMLEKYRDDLRIWHISGDNFYNQKDYNDNQYYFSKIPFIWGWATWSNRWNYYDVNMVDFKTDLAKTSIRNFFVDNKKSKYWIELFEKNLNNNLDAWDFQWAYTCFINNGLSINPNVNLVSNIGFGPEATHTKTECRISNLKRFDIQFPITKLDYVSPLIHLDCLAMKKMFFKKNIVVKAINKITKSLLSKEFL